MAAITKMASAGDAAVRAVKAGIDVILDSPDSAAAAAANRRRRQGRRRSRARTWSSRRAAFSRRRRASACIARAPSIWMRCRSPSAAASTMRLRASVSERSITLVKDARNSVPLPTPKTGQRPVSVGARLSVRLAHCRAEPRRDPRVEEALGRIPNRWRSPIARHPPSSSWCGPWPTTTTRSSPACSCAPHPAAAASISRRRWCGCCRICRASASVARSRSWRCSSAIPTRRCSCRRFRR